MTPSMTRGYLTSVPPVCPGHSTPLCTGPTSSVSPFSARLKQQCSLLSPLVHDHCPCHSIPLAWPCETPPVHWCPLPSPNELAGFASLSSYLLPMLVSPKGETPSCASLPLAFLHGQAVTSPRSRWLHDFLVRGKVTTSAHRSASLSLVT